VQIIYRIVSYRILAVFESRRTDAANLTNVKIARFRECKDLVRDRKCEVLVEYEAKVTSRVSIVLREELCIFNYFSKLLFKSDEKKFSLQESSCECEH